MSPDEFSVGRQPGRKPGPYRLLFICTGNSCRSPMAEGLARRYGMDRIVAFSAGVAPAPLNPKAVQVMAEIQVDIGDHARTSLRSVPIEEMDLVVTLCDYARLHAPIGPSSQHRLHWSIADPSRLWGPQWLVLHGYRQVRDELDRRIRGLMQALLKPR